MQHPYVHILKKAESRPGEITLPGLNRLLVDFTMATKASYLLTAEHELSKLLELPK